MRLRQVPPVYSPVRATSLVRALPAFVDRRVDAHRPVADALVASHRARSVLLSESGTSALVLALRAAVPRGGAVAMPGYGCIDLVAAAIRADVRVRLYDVDPSTLSPDLDSVRTALSSGASAVVVAHLYGYAADVPAVAALAASYGAVVIEDAAQSAGGTLGDRALGSFGPLVVLSFGRGKGMTGGAGGALLATTAEWSARVDTAARTLPTPDVGFRPLLAAGAQLMLGSPALYALPASIPFLRLGEMVYKPAGEPRAMPMAVAALLHDAMRDAARVVDERRARAAELLLVAIASGLRTIRPVEGSVPGFLRLPMLEHGRRATAPGLGIVRGYPLTLRDMAELQPILLDASRQTPGAEELRDRLLTLPTHARCSDGDVARLRRWIDAPVTSLGDSARNAGSAFVARSPKLISDADV
jgi:perosamine synthetase